MSEKFFDRVYASPDYIDLRHIADDKRVLKNPHKGWFYHYIDNGYARPSYRNGIPEGDHLENVPGLENIYLRIDWCDIEKTEGVYDWSYIDSIFDEWSKYGYTFSFRICCYEGVGIEYATPKWVRDAGCGGTEVKHETKNGVITTWEPDYSDPIFLEKLEGFLKAFGEKFNGNRLVEYVDIGTYGTWGEGHTGHGSKKHWNADTLRRHVDMHLKYLPQIQLYVNDDMITEARLAGKSSFGEDGNESAMRFIDYCAGKGLGIRDDSVCVKFYSEEFSYNTLRQESVFDHFNETSPVSLEFEHYASVSKDCFKEGFAFLEAIKRTRATYAGFHGALHPWIDDHYYMTEYIANRLGYWYFVTGINLPKCVSGAKTFASLKIENRGMAPCYTPYRLEVCAVADDKRYILYCGEGENLGWTDKTEQRLKLDFTSVPQGEYVLELGLFENKRPILLAIDQKLEHDGYYKLCNFNVEKLYN